jgi:benzoate membrane transport protein
MLADLRMSHVVAGIVAVLVGYTGSVAIIFQAIEAAGASQAQANSWMLALGGGCGVSSLYLSLRHRMPVLTAWSTPGAARLEVALPGVPLGEAVGAFVFCEDMVTRYKGTPTPIITDRDHSGIPNTGRAISSAPPPP